MSTPASSSNSGKPTLAELEAAEFDPTSVGLPADFVLTSYSRLKG